MATHVVWHDFLSTARGAHTAVFIVWRDFWVPFEGLMLASCFWAGPEIEGLIIAVPHYVRRWGVV